MQHNKGKKLHKEKLIASCLRLFHIEQEILQFRVLQALILLPLEMNRNRFWRLIWSTSKNVLSQNIPHPILLTPFCRSSRLVLRFGNCTFILARKWKCHIVNNLFTCFCSIRTRLKFCTISFKEVWHAVLHTFFSSYNFNPKLTFITVYHMLVLRAREPHNLSRWRFFTCHYIYTTFSSSSFSFWFSSSCSVASWSSSIRSNN